MSALAIQGLASARKASAQQGYVAQGNAVRGNISKAIIAGQEAVQAREVSVVGAILYNALGRVQESLDVVGAVVDVRA